MSCKHPATHPGDGGAEPPTSTTPFIDLLPSPAAKQAFLAWRAARRDDLLPLLSDFAPHRLPPTLMPWVLIQRERADGEIVYGLVGDELSYMFTDNPKGQPVLRRVAPEDRTRRLAIIRKAMDTGLPVWFTGTLLFTNRDQLPVGRLSLPARSGKERVLMVIYFLLEKTPSQARPQPDRPGFDPHDTHWCTPADLDAPAGNG